MNRENLDDEGGADCYGFEPGPVVECDRCHQERSCCSVDFEDGSGEWDYCRSCWRKLAESGAFERIWG